MKADVARPDILIVGVHRAGTTSAVDALATHRQIQAPRWKELRALEPLCWGAAPDLSIYRKAFRGPRRDGALLVEATPTYAAMGELAAREIATWDNQPHIILMLRSPRRQFASHLALNLVSDKLNGDWRGAQEACLASWQAGNRLPFDGSGTPNPAWILAESMYSDYLNEWVSRFGERLTVVVSEGLWAAPQECGAQLLSRLDLPPQDLPWHLIRNAQGDRHATSTLAHRISELMARQVGDRSRVYRTARQVSRLGGSRSQQWGDLLPPIEKTLADEAERMVPLLQALGHQVIGLDAINDWFEVGSSSSPTAKQQRILIWDEHRDGHHRRWIEAMAHHSPVATSVVIPEWLTDMREPTARSDTVAALRHAAKEQGADVVVIAEAHALVRRLALTPRLPRVAFVMCDLRCTQAVLAEPAAYPNVSMRRRIEARVSLLAREVVARRRPSQFGYLNPWAMNVGTPSLRRCFFAIPDPTELLPPPPQNSSATSRFVFVVAGALTERKGTDLAIEALHKVLTDRPDLVGAIKLRLAGKLSPEAREDVDRRRADLDQLDPDALSVTDRFLSNAELGAELGNADALLLPYRSVFGSSGMLSSAVALRPTRVIASDFGWLGYVTAKSGGITFADCDADSLADRMAQVVDERNTSIGVISTITEGFGSERDFATSIWDAVARVADT